MITRRSVLKVLAGLSAAVATGPALAVSPGNHPSVAFMNKFAKEMMAANKSSTARKFYEVIRVYADVGGISTYSLGEYKPKLPSSKRTQYFAAVNTFMARYFFDQSKEYKVSKYELEEPRVDEDKNVVITSKIFLASGGSYNVTWELKWIGGQYRVADAKIMGFSMINMQRSLFTSFLDKRDGDIDQLVVALNR